MGAERRHTGESRQRKGISKMGSDTEIGLGTAPPDGECPEHQSAADRSGASAADGDAVRESNVDHDKDKSLESDVHDYGEDGEVGKQYVLPTPKEKVERAMVYKEKGNALVKEKKWAEARKEYDNAFVNIFCSKEEWEAMSNEQRLYINFFKLPLHLNRALCRIKTQDWDDAHWDCSEALRIEPDNVKGLYRRGLVLIGQTRREMAKEDAKEYWDVEYAEDLAKQAQHDLDEAHALEKKDGMILAALADLKRVKAQLARHHKNYTEQQRKLYSHMVNNLDKDNTKIRHNEQLLSSMPALEPFRIPASTD
ncbi:Peptidyl-prolyl cis-trans isomerase FKBP4 [Porphyridium purpureum]|uniref:Peptidyl-prolyl cis-trans isomerase FKBP4 n=1 Tax=Porphyridium purpureum TaxID=35688 RepID=A0A5J4Z6R6_PORPP|nr:Peptidyl-prolyl cis-trans isomerase FKBP4 [Porphyridium purpureum]|eukprot:POR4928..scf295_1